MTAWSELVATALLGTGRRPVPTELPSWADPLGATGELAAEARLLDLAAAHRVAALAGRVPTRMDPGAGPTAVPAQSLPLAPPAATELLAAFLGRPDPTTVNLWLTACGRFGRGAAAEHWAGLAGLAARSTAYDRRSLDVALGARGRWFVRQNPEWAKLAKALDEFAVGRSSDPSTDSAHAGLAVLPSEDQLRKDPQLLLAVPDPWPASLLGAALAGLVAGRTGTGSRSFARALGSRLSAVQYAELGRSAGGFLELPQLNPAQRRAVRSLFVEIEKAGFDRIEIDRAFNPGTGRVFKINIPHV